MTPAKQTILTLAAAFCAGLGASYLWYNTDNSDQAALQQMERVNTPENGIKTAAFPVRLLQAAAQAQPEGNIILAPDSLVALLQRLKELSGGPALAALGSAKLPEDVAQTSIRPSELALIFTDTDLQLAPEIPTGRDIYAVPFSKDLPEAYIAIDKALAFYSEQELGGTPLSGLIPPTKTPFLQKAGAKAANTELKLLGVNGISFHEPWMQTPNPTNTATGAFTNEDATSAIVEMVKHEGRYRVAQAEDGSWKAVAIFFRNDEKDGESACLVAVLPADNSVRKFVKESLTPEKLTEIRRALVQAPRENCTIEIPRLNLPPTSQDLTPLLKQTGLGGLFTESRPLPKLTQGDAKLGMVIQQSRLKLEEHQGLPEGSEPEARVLGYPTAIKFDRPFFWYIGDLTSDRAPYLIGTIEKL